jgi:CSLREA domain-containing protein
MSLWGFFRGPVRRLQARFFHRAYLAAGLLFYLLQSTTPTWAQSSPATYTVNNTSDPSSGTASNCTAGNSNTCTLRDAIAAANSGSGGASILFDSSLNGATITLSGSQLEISTTAQSVTITGLGAGLLTISGDGYSRCFWIGSGATANISGMTLTNGSDDNDTGGGGIHVERGTLTLNDVTIDSNNGNGIFSNLSTLTVNRSTISNNNAGNGGGIEAFGGSLTVSGSSIVSNASTNPGSTLPSGEGGGGIYLINATASVSGSFFTLNQAGSGGGIYNGGVLTVTNSKFIENSAMFYGGGILNNTGNLVVDTSSFLGNGGYYGGGIYDRANLPTTITQSNFFHNYAVYGGGLYNQVGMTVSGSAFSGNLVTSGQYDEVDGGAIYNVGTLMTVNESTFTNNFAHHKDATTYGGAFYNRGTATLNNSTITGNSADLGGGFYNHSSATLNVYNSIVPDSVSNLGAYNQSGNITSGSGLNLSPLGWYGGPTPSMLPLPGSTAICAGSTSYGSSTDQRGFALDATCSSAKDAGAVQTNWLTVTSLTDSNDGSCGSSLCSLRDAITTANSSDSTGADILFASGLSGTMTLSSALPQITGMLNLTNLNGAAIIIDGGGSAVDSSVLRTGSGAAVAISNLTLTGGYASSGGGIDNAGTLTVSNTTISGNTAEISGGGMSNESTGLLLLNESTVVANTAGMNGGGVNNSGTLNVTSATISDNTASGSGGGIENADGGVPATFNSIVEGNTSNGATNTDDCDGCGAQSSYNLVNLSSTSAVGPPSLSSLQTNGANPANKTMILLPGSTAICQGDFRLSGDIADQRGFARTVTGYSSMYTIESPCMDLGAVQTNYTGVAFVARPTNSFVHTLLATTPTVAVQETNTLTGVISVVNDVPVTLRFSGGASEISGTLTQTTTGGVAAFDDLSVNTIGSGYYFTTDAITVITQSGNYTFTLASANSSTFDVSDAMGSFTVAPASAAQTVGTAFMVTVKAIGKSGDTYTSYTGTPTLTSSDGQTITVNSSSCASGMCTFNITLNTASSGLTLTATDSTYSGVSSSVTVNQIAQTISFTAPTTPVTYGASPISLIASASSGLAVSFTASGTCSVSGSTLSFTSAGACTVTASQAGNTNYSAATSVTNTVTVNKSALSITASSASTSYGAAGPTITPGYFGWVNSDSASVLSPAPTCSTTYTATSAPGSYPTTCSGAAAANYSISYTAGAITVSQASQTISFTAPTTPVTYGASPVSLTASASSGLAVSFTASGTCSVFGSTLSFTSAGACTVTASQAGNTNYAAASEVVRAVTVNVAALTATASSKAVSYGAAVSTITASYTGWVGTDTSSVLTTQPTCSTTYTTTSAPGSYPTTCSGAAAANYSIGYVAGSIAVGKAAPTLTVSTPASAAYGGSYAPTIAYTGDGTVSLSGDGTYCTVSGSGTSYTVNYTKAGTCTLTIGAAQGMNYTAIANFTEKLTVAQAALTVTASSASVSYGAAVSTVTASYTGWVNGDTSNALITAPACSTTYTATSAPGSYPTSCSGAAAANYNIGYVAGSIAVSPASQTISFSPLATPITYRASSVELSATTSSGLAVSFAASGACAISGSVTLNFTSAGTCTVVATQAGSSDYAAATPVSYTVTVNQATLAITWATPAAITYGTTLSATQLDASANVPGVFVYSPLAGTTPAVGSVTLSVVFTPTDTTDYTTATASVTLTVNAAIIPTPTLGAISPAYTAAGASAFTLTLDGTNFDSGSTVYFNSTALTTTYVSAAQLTATVPASLVASVGIYPVSVVSSSGTSSNTMEFAVTSSISTSTTITVSTTSATVSAGGTASYSVTVPSTASSVSATCLNLPAGASCSYSSGILSIVTSSVTPKSTYAITVVFTETFTSTTTSLILLPFLLLPFFWLRRKVTTGADWIAGCLALLVLVGAMTMSGCGGSSTSNTTSQITSGASVTLVIK